MNWGLLLLSVAFGLSSLCTVGVAVAYFTQDEEEPETVAEIPDAGPPDAGPPDSGPPDSGPPDAGPPDAGPPDTGPPDTGPPDNSGRNRGRRRIWWRGQGVRGF